MTSSFRWLWKAFTGPYGVTRSPRSFKTHETLKLIQRGTSTDQAATSADHLIVQMKTHFSDALVTGWEPLEGTYGLRDPDDEHVVAAAVIGGADAIVTANIKDFDAVPAEIQVQPPHEFC